LWRWENGEAKLGFLTIVDGESLKEERSESRSGTSTDGVEDEETLESSALVSKLSDSVKAEIDDFLTNGVMASGEIVGGVFLTGDELLWMEELSVGTCSNLVNDGWLQVEENASWNMLSSSGLGEESVEGIVSSTDRFV